MDPEQMEKAKSILPDFPSDTGDPASVLGWIVVVFVLIYFLDVVVIRPRAVRRSEEARANDRKEERTAFLDSLKDVSSSHSASMKDLHIRMDRHEDQAAARARALENKVEEAFRGTSVALNGLSDRVDTVQASIHNAPVYRAPAGRYRSGAGWGGIEVVAPEPEPSNAHEHEKIHRTDEAPEDE